VLSSPHWPLPSRPTPSSSYGASAAPALPCLTPPEPRERERRPTHAARFAVALRSSGGRVASMRPSTWSEPYSGVLGAGTPSEAAESEAFWPSVMGDERAEHEAFWPSQTAPPPRQRSFRPFNLRSGVTAAARPSLFHMHTSARPQRMGLLITTAVAASAMMGLALSILLVHTQVTQPLFPLAPLGSLDWHAQWLATAAAEYLGVCFCLCGVIACSEPPRQAACWSLGCSLLGAPVCCLYLSVRLYRHGSLALR
jgi:hypothetical protein